jgi:hypothetical protein
LIETANPRGVQLLAVRLAELAGQRYLPEPWPYVRPLVLGAIERHVPAGSLGDVNTMLPSWDALTSALAALYERMQYGGIPRVQTAPTPAAPQTQEQLTVPDAWTTDDSIASSFEAWKKQYDDSVQAAEDSGTYNPDGNLPLDASGNLNFSASALVWWAAIGGIVALLWLTRRK